MKKKTRPIKPAPSDFVEVFARIGVIYKTAKHYRVSHTTCSRWVKELGLKAPNPHGKKDAPDDFKEIAPTMIKQELAIHYQVSAQIINRWLIECNVEAMRYKPVFQPFFINPRVKTSTIPPAKNDHEHHRAANYLRKFMAVSSCDEQGKYQENGSHYRIGYSIFTHQEVIDRAQSHQERAMRKIFASSKAA